MDIKRNEIFAEVFTLQNFLSKQECDGFIEHAQSIGFKEAKISLPEGERIVKNVRNNDRVVYKDYELADKIFNRAKPFLPQIINGDKISRFNEMVRFYRYTSGQRFKMHKDGSYKASENEASKLSFLVYLNQDCGGGETVIQEYVITSDCKRCFLEHYIKPETGMALIFPHELWHEGRPVISGYKYVLRFDVIYTKKSILSLFG